MPANRFRPIIPGATYFITSVTFQRQPWFANSSLAQLVVDQLAYYQTEYGFVLHSYAILPDHYHAVITPGATKTISQILHAIHSYTATCINQHLGKTIKIKYGRGTPGILSRVMRLPTGGCAVTPCSIPGAPAW
jgi:putative transposase